jgi:beta-lactamase class A
VQVDTATGSALFNLVFQKDSQRTSKLLPKLTAAEVVSQISAQRATGYHALDIWPYAVGGAVYYALILVKDARISASAVSVELTQSAFESERITRANDDYVLEDAEYYSKSASADDIAYAGVWLQYRNPDAELSIPIGNLSSELQRSVTNIRDRGNASKIRFGFVVEDLVRGNYVGYHMQDAFYMADVSKLLVAAATLNGVRQGDTFDQTSKPYPSTAFTLKCADSMILSRQQPPASEGTFTLRELLGFMLSNNSDTAEDVLTRSLSSPLNIYPINSFISGKLTNVGELVGNCAQDQRMLKAQNGCVMDVSCGELERWLREKTEPSDHEQCIKSLNPLSENDYAAHYANFTNSITPLEFAHFWRGVLQTTFVSQASRDLLLGSLERQVAGSRNALVGSYFSEQAGISASAYKAEGYSGIGFDFNAADNTATARYSITWFAEGFADDSEASHVKARKLATDSLNDALKILRAAP